MPYSLEVKTSSCANCGTTNPVSFKIFGEYLETDFFSPSSLGYTPNQVVTLKPDLPDVGSPECILITQNTGVIDNWTPTYVKITYRGISRTFNIGLELSDLSTGYLSMKFCGFFFSFFFLFWKIRILYCYIIIKSNFVFLLDNRNGSFCGSQDKRYN